MENIILVGIALLATYYIYRKTFKSGSCNCGKNSCKSEDKI
ncbi:FeoB-associated Cys-rich membrane protein [Arcobacter porcinus]|nr:FeoB-associated Cys-rich membrane protein [Arcobacter porcinus]OCL81770.1 Virus attachment protein p12 family protein [Arcobacter porcinus]